jgi:aspartate-semialdehyde dehydrogenase
MGLWPLHQAFTAKRVIITTFQSVSGTGAEAIRELAQQVKALQTGAQLVKKVYPYQIAFNCIPQVDTFGPDLYTGEENKMMLESRKIMGLPDLRVSATCVRVPVVQAHSISVSAEFEKPVDVAQARTAVAAFPGAELVDDPANRLYPTPLDFTRKVKCGVGRIRKDTAFDNGLSFWVSGDNLWKGAALNAIQVAETLIARDLLRVPAA